MELYWKSLFAISLYFIILFFISYFKSRNAKIQDYLVGSRNSAWWLVTFGMISDTLSGVSYVSVPGNSVINGYNYLFIALGNFIGSLIICFVILPIYFKKNLISIYSTLRENINGEAEKVSALLFFISRSFGSAARLYLSITLLYSFLSPILPFSLSMAFIICMTLILFYTWKGGIKSLIWTDAYQSFFLLVGFFATFFYLYNQLDHAPVFFQFPAFVTDINSSQHFLKLFIGGVFINIAMNGLDQNMMQKCISCPSLKDAQKNIFSMGLIALVLSSSFVFMGRILASYYQQFSLSYPINVAGNVITDKLLTQIVFNHLPPEITILFILGLTAATFSSADSVLTTLATTFHFDLLNEKLRKKVSIRTIHFLIAVFILLILFLLTQFSNYSMIDVILKYSTYAYGPLLGLFSILIFHKHHKPQKYVIILSSISSILTSYFLSGYLSSIGYNVGLELLLINTLLFLFYYHLGKTFRKLL